MTWARIDDTFHAHPKAARAWKCRPALGLHLLAISYCAAYLTDGVVDSAFVLEKLPRKRERALCTAALVDAGLWRPHPNGFLINDWLDYNPSRDSILQRRRADSDRKRNGRETRWAVDSERNPGGIRSESVRNPGGVRLDSDGPDPTRPFKREITKEKRPAKSESKRIGGPTHDDANAAGQAWAARKRERERGE